MTPGSTPIAGSTSAAATPGTSAGTSPNASASPGTTVTAAPSPTPEPPIAGPLDNNGVPVISPKQANAKLFTQNWRVTLEGGSDPDLVGEADGMVFIKTRQGGLFALDAKTGAVAWKIPAPPIAGALPIFLPLAVAGPGIVALGDLAAEKISGYDTKTGQKKWDFDLRFSAPNRDPGNRFIGGKIYDQTLVVAVSSKQNPFEQASISANPEYLHLTGIDLNSGKLVWAALTDPPSPTGFGLRLGGVIFGSKNVYVESPDLSIGALIGSNGTRLWQLLNTLVLHNDNPDLLYTVVPEAGAEHYPILRKNDPQTGKVLWELELPVTTIGDPPIAVSPDDKTAYVSAVISPTESYLYGIDLTKNEGLWRFNSSIFKDYVLTATNEGVRLRNFGNRAGIALFPRDKPIPATYALGPFQLADEVNAPEGLYLTTTDPRIPGLLYLVNPSQSDVLYAAKTEAISGEPLPGETQVYLAASDTAGKPVVYAFARPKT